MRDSLRAKVFSYLVAVLATGVVVLLRLGFWEVLGTEAPFLSFLAAVIVAAWVGGFSAGVLATLLGFFAADFLLVEPFYSLRIPSLQLVLHSAIYLVVGTLVSRMSQTAHDARRKQRQSLTELEHEREAEQQLALAQEAGRMGSWQWDLRTNQVVWSPELLTLHGLLPGQSPASFGAYQEHVYPEDRARVLEAVEGTLRRGSDYTVEYRVVWPDRSIHWIEGRGRLFRDQAGAPSRMIAVCIDITERKRAEIALRDSEQRFGHFMEHLPGLAWIKDLAGRYVYANDAAEKTFRMSRGELYGKTDEEVFLPEVAAQFRENDQRVATTGSAIQAIETLPQEDGILHHSVVNKFLVPGPEGAPDLVGGIAIDITEHKRAEEALEQQNLRLQLLGEAAGLLLTAEHTDSMLHGLFAIIAPHLGLDLYTHFAVTENGDGLLLASWSGIADEDAQRYSRLGFGEAVSGSVALQRTPMEVMYVQQSTDAISERARLQGLRSYVCYPLLAEGRLLGTLAFGSHSRDEFSPEDLHFLHTVSRYVTVASERLRLIEQLREADRRKDEFLATLAHELRNPLAPIRNALHIQRLADGDQSTLEQARVIMERQLAQLVRLVDDLLDVSRITRGKLELRTELVRLETLVQSAVEANQSFIETNGHQLHFSYPPEPVYLNGDVTRLSQILLNLLNNAIKFTPPGGTIWITGIREADNRVAISVRDSGIGIPAEMLPRIFEMFAQAGHALDRSHSGGLGIGLTLVKRLVEMHGGSVEARSEGTNRGSEFIVHLPVAAAPEPDDAVDVRQSPVSQAMPGLRILVADDNHESAESLALMLELMGNEVRTAHNGIEAVAMAEGFQPDVALLDIGMPKLNGYEVARRIREHPTSSRIMLIALTGWGQATDKQRSLEAGFDHHLTKPVEPHTLERLLASSSWRQLEVESRQPGQPTL